MSPEPSSPSPGTAASPHRKVLYLNITVVDASMAIESTVETRIHGKWLPAPLKRAIATRAAKAASNMASPPVVAHWLAKKLPTKLTDMLVGKGISIAVHAVFQQGPLVVFSIQVLKVDAVALASSSNKQHKQRQKQQISVYDSDDANSNIQECTKNPQQEQTHPNQPTSASSTSVLSSIVSLSMDWLPHLPRQYLETRTLPNMVQQHLQDSLADVLRAKFHNRRVLAETVLLPQEEQARYFFDHLQQLQQRPQPQLVQHRESQSQRSQSSLTTPTYEK